ncbi:Hydrolase [Aspergillus sp. HF37]|nr:Hydrolase [Aspergillus sp. HF37]
MASPEMTSPTGYNPIEDYGCIGDMHTCALVSKSGSIDFMCWPVFDSPSLFCRLLDKTKGGHFSISAEPRGPVATNKQKYVPYTNMLETRWMKEGGVVDVLDFFPASSGKETTEQNFISTVCPCHGPYGTKPDDRPRRHSSVVRKVTCTRGEMDMTMELFPSFNYARDTHEVEGQLDRTFEKSRTQSVLFKSGTESLRLVIHADSSKPDLPAAQLELQDREDLRGRGVSAKLRVAMGQTVTFILHNDEVTVPQSDIDTCIAKLEKQTFEFWTSWARQCSYRGHYREQVLRSLLTLKLLTYKPTGAIVAAPTFSLPEEMGGSRNWDYRYSWVRDTAFTLYVFLKNGYSEEAEQYMSFIFNSVLPKARLNEEDEQLLPIILTIRGETEIGETELPHLEGYRGSAPVRVGNAATSHIQHDIYGALFDCIYLYNKHVGPVSYDQWVSLRRIVNSVRRLYERPDMSIWEVRGQKQHFVYSKIMLWVTFDRAIRLAEKRSNLPRPDIMDWRVTRDKIYDDIMVNGYNADGGFFSMSYENRDTLDASILVAPLVFFIAPDDPRFISTMKKIMQPPAEGGLTTSKMVLRYDHIMAKDGTFPLCEVSTAAHTLR